MSDKVDFLVACLRSVMHRKRWPIKRTNHKESHATSCGGEKNTTVMMNQ